MKEQIEKLIEGWTAEFNYLMPLCHKTDRTEAQEIDALQATIYAKCITDLKNLLKQQQ